jgi:hypothetical protein
LSLNPTDQQVHGASYPVAMGQEPMAGMLSGTVEADSTLIDGKLRTGTPASMGGKKSGKERNLALHKAAGKRLTLREPPGTL